jgi:hypothetical protein
MELASLLHWNEFQTNNILLHVNLLHSKYIMCTSLTADIFEYLT